MHIVVGEIKYHFLFELWFLIVPKVTYVLFYVGIFSFKYVNKNNFFTSLMLMLNHIEYIFLVFHKLINFGN